MQQTLSSDYLFEGLRPLDLINMVDPVFDVDAYRSKMGEDQDVCVLSFKVKDRSPAIDLMEFLEKGYTFVLDSDVSSGENNAGQYFVFVELMRTSRLIDQIKDLLYGVKKLSGIEEWQFRYYKQRTPIDVSFESLKQTIPFTPQAYNSMMNDVRTEDIKSFFNKTLMDGFSVDGDLITIQKPFSQQVQLKLVRDDTKESIIESLTDTPIGLDNVAMGEIFWLTKVLGDYNINKLGENFVFENGERALLLQRVIR